MIVFLIVICGKQPSLRNDNGRAEYCIGSRWWQYGGGSAVVVEIA